MCVRGGKLFAYPCLPLQKGGDEELSCAKRKMGYQPTCRKAPYQDREAGAPIVEILVGKGTDRLGNAAETRSMLYVAKNH